MFLSEVACTGDENIISDCDSIKQAADDGKGAHVVIQAAGVRCGPPVMTGTTGGLSEESKSSNTSSTAPTIAMVIMAVVLVVALVIIIG